MSAHFRFLLTPSSLPAIYCFITFGFLNNLIIAAFLWRQILINMKCPSCSVNLVMTERNGVEIDYCPECRGVWLDRGELDKIIDRSVPSSAPVASDYREDRTHRQPDSEYYKKKRKDSFLGDLFDF